MNVRLNLATKPLESHRRFMVGSALIAFFGGILFLALGWHMRSELKSREALRLKEQQNNALASTLQTRRRELDEFFARSENARLQERATFVNGLIDERSFDWTLMFMDLEKLLPAGVHVISIQPQLEKGRMFVHFSVAASSDDTKIKFLRAIEASPAFSRVQLVNVQKPNGQTADQALLELNAVYTRS